VFSVFVLAVPYADAQGTRSTRVDLGGWSGYDGVDCAAAVLPGDISGSQVTLGSFTLAGYDPIWDAGTGDFSGCQLAQAGASDFEFSASEQAFRDLLGPTEEIYAKRFSFFTEQNLFALSFGFQGVGDDRYGYQWEIWYFADAIVAALTGPVQATKNAQDGLDYTDLTVTDTTTYLFDGTNSIGGATNSFGSNFLCFSADASTFNGVKTAAQLESCRGDDGDDDDVSEVPLPGTLGLLGVGIAALGVVRRRQRA
jgi:hypothetical protein